MSYTSKYTGPEIDSLLDSIGQFGGYSEEVLWSGNTDKSSDTTLNLSKDINEFDFIGFYATVHSIPDNLRYIYRTAPVLLVKEYIETNTSSNNTIPFGWGYADMSDYFDIRIGSTSTSFELRTNLTEVTKVVGIKLSSAASGASSSNPIGAIVPIMGTTAPKDHLICDGSELNINEYKELADYFEAQFGSKNHFGGDGTTTFAVPDLRNEFLRGYGDRTENIGIHQDATEHISFYSKASTKQLQVRVDSTDVGYVENSVDEEIKQLPTSCINITGGSSHVDSTMPLPSYYTSRPTNVAVLFCIKYTESISANAGNGSGYKEVELLSEPLELGMSTSATILNREIVLADEVTNYNTLVFSCDIKATDGGYYNLLTTTLFVSDILYNTSENYANVKDGATFALNAINNASTIVGSSASCYFKNPNTFAVGYAVTNKSNYNYFRIRSIKGIKY